MAEFLDAWQAVEDLLESKRQDLCLQGGIGMMARTLMQRGVLTPEQALAIQRGWAAKGAEADELADETASLRELLPALRERL